MTPTNDDFAAIIALEIAARPDQVGVAIELLDEESKVPFIERYRQKAIGDLDDGQLRRLVECLTVMRKLGTRRKGPETIETSGATNDELDTPSVGNSTPKTKDTDSVGESVLDTEPAGGRRGTLADQIEEEPQPTERGREDIAIKAGQHGWRVKQRKTAPSAKPAPHYVKSGLETERSEPNRISRSASVIASVRDRAKRIQRASLSPNTAKPAVAWKALSWSRSRYVQAVAWLTGMSTVAAAAVLMLFSGDLTAGYDGRYQIAQLSQLLAQLTMKTDEPGSPAAASDEQNASADPLRLDRPFTNKVDVEAGMVKPNDNIVGVANASSLPEQTSIPEAEGAALLSTPSSSQELRRAEASDRLLAKNARHGRQRLPSAADGPSADPHMDQPVEPSHDKPRLAEVTPDGLAATTRRSNPGIMAPPPPLTADLSSTAAAQYWVQVAAMHNEVDARRAWDRSEDDVGTMVTVAKPRFERSKTSDGFVYKVQFGPFQGRREAQDLCTWMTERDATCFVVSRRPMMNVTEGIANLR